MSVWNYRHVFLRDIIAEAANIFGLPEAQIVGRSRERRYLLPRYACCYLGRRLTSMSYPMIGRAFDNRDHSSVIHAVRRAKHQLERDPEYRAYIDAIRIRLLSTRDRAERRRREAKAVERARLRREMEELERQAREAAEARKSAEEPALDDMDEISRAVAAYQAKGGTFVEVRV